MILDKDILVTVNNQSIKWLEKLGYNNLKYKSKIKVPIDKMSQNSYIYVNVKCDYCGKEWKRAYCEIIEGRKTVSKDSCKKCSKIKLKEVLLLKYGVENISELPEIRKKAMKTTLKRFGTFSAYHTKMTEEDVFKIIKEKSNCKIISIDIIDGFMKTYINLICECGNPFKVSLHEFLYGDKRQCNTCGIKLRSGENSSNWKGGLVSIEEKIRKSTAYKEWRTLVFKRDNYTCQCCSDNKGHNLHAHHIENFSSNGDLRFNVDNGITLCDYCHNPNKYGSFHNVYGAKNNNRQQLEEYIKRYKNDEFKSIKLMNSI